MKQDEARIERIYALFDEYRQAYAAEWQRLERCERLYMGEHWHDVPQSDTREPRPVTPVLQSTIENIRADLMDQMPEAIITADDPANERAAQALTEILGENHRRCHYENEYAKLLHDLLIGGYMVQETGFDPHADGGLGGAFLRHADAHNVMVDPMCADIQDSRAVFKFAPYPKEWFKSRYPDDYDKLKPDANTIMPQSDAHLGRGNAAVGCAARKIIGAGFLLYALAYGLGILGYVRGQRRGWEPGYARKAVPLMHLL